MPIKVSIVEDDAGIRQSLAGLLNMTEGFQCISSFSNVESALKTLPHEWPDVVLMDINLPRISGIDGVAKLKALRPSLLVLMLTVYAENEKIFQSLKAGANGYLLKQTPPVEILQAITDVHRGGAPMSGPIARRLVEHFQRHAPGAEAENLSKRELEILDYLSQGYHNKEVAQMLEISVETVRTHLRRIYEKLHVSSKTEAVIKYLKR
jgi:DNA-binding NarL/FixJ family response regulator